MNEHLLEDSEKLQATIVSLIAQRCGCEALFPNEPSDRVLSSSVLLLLGNMSIHEGDTPEICLILNKRSPNVRQGGDLCCPGGTARGGLDVHLSRILMLPGSPLTRWPHWPHLRKHCPEEARLLSFLYATAMREAWEEMRLNPLGVRFLGPLSSQCLIVFRRVIHPMVGWVTRQKRFALSREVEKIVTIPLKSLLDPTCYARYRLHVPPRLQWRFNGSNHQFPCFVYRDQGTEEILWGVTYRIVSTLLEMVFDFRPPDGKLLREIHGTIEEDYVYGRQEKG